MKKILTQEEIDSLFRAARREDVATAPGAPENVESWDLHGAGRISSDQLRTISQFHESFARNMSDCLSAYLRTKAEIVLASVEQLPFRDVATRTPETAYFASFELMPPEARGVLQLDLEIVFPIVDLLLGGQGRASSATRELSETEEFLLDAIGQIVCREFQTTWRPLGISFRFEQHQPSNQALRAIPAQEKTLALSFEVTIADVRGALNIAFPAVVASALLRRMNVGWPIQRPRELAAPTESLPPLLASSMAKIELSTRAIPLKAADLLRLRPGMIMLLRHAAEERCLLRLAGKDYWRAMPVCVGEKLRAAQLLEHIRQPLGEFHL